MMLHFAPDAVECALLYQADYSNVDFDDLLGYLNAVFQAPGQRFARGAMGGQRDFDMFVGHGMVVLVSQNHQPLGPAGFEGALRSAYTSLLLDDADVRVAGHQANIFVTVSSNVPMPTDHPLLEELGALLPKAAQTRQAFETKLTLCRLLAGYIAKQKMPSVVHWCQSNSLLSADAFIALAGQNETTWLHLHPGFYSPGNDAEGRQLLGASLNGAAQLINVNVTFKPAPVPPAFIVERMANFVDMVRLRDGEMLPDGESFGIDETEIIRVRHLKPISSEPGEVELTLERQDAFSIARPEPHPGRGVDAKSRTEQTLVIPDDSPARNGLSAAKAPEDQGQGAETPELATTDMALQPIPAPGDAAPAATPADATPVQAPHVEATAATASRPAEAVALPPADVDGTDADAVRVAAKLPELQAEAPLAQESPRRPGDAPADFVWSSSDLDTGSLGAMPPRERITRENAPKPKVFDLPQQRSLFGRLRSLGR